MEFLPILCRPQRTEHNDLIEFVYGAGHIGRSIPYWPSPASAPMPVGAVSGTRVRVLVMWSPNPVLTVVSRGTSPDPWTMVFCGVEFGAERATVFEAPARAGAGTRTRSGRRPVGRRTARTGTSSTRDGTASNSPCAMAHTEPEHRSCRSTRPTPRRRATDARTRVPRTAGVERSSPPPCGSVSALRSVRVPRSRRSAPRRKIVIGMIQGRGFAPPGARISRCAALSPA